MDPTIREWLFAREMVRRLGFAAEDIYFVVQSSGLVVERGQMLDLGKPAIGLELRTQNRVFLWTIGGVDLALDKIEPAYQAACELWNDPARSETEFPHEEFIASRPFEQRIGLIQALQSKGFRFRVPAPSHSQKETP